MILSEPGPIPQAPVGQFCRHNLSPRGDGNNPLFRGFHPVMGHNLSPRGDGNYGRRVCDKQFTGHNLSPRGDGNRCVLAVEREAHDTTYPREGTETSFPPRGRGRCRDTTYPREGTETLLLLLLKRFLKTQLIPARGRKPSGLAFVSLTNRLTQLIPARGRKLICRRRRSCRPGDTTYPREGTETYRKPDGYCGTYDTTYPREGTETPFTEVTPASLAGHNLSPRGDGNLLLLCSSVFAVEPDTTYPREGTETF